MAQKLSLNLPSADDLFSSREEREDAQREKVVDLPISEIDDFPDHPYPVEMDEEMQNTVESVKAYGVHTPALVRPKEDGRYEMVSGHRRKMASTLAGLETMPCIVRQMSHDEAKIMGILFSKISKLERPFLIGRLRFCVPCPPSIENSSPIPLSFINLARSRLINVQLLVIDKLNLSPHFSRTYFVKGTIMESQQSMGSPPKKLMDGISPWASAFLIKKSAAS